MNLPKLPEPNAPETLNQKLYVRLIVSRIDRNSTIRQRLFRNSSYNRHGGKLLKHTLLILTVVMLAVSLIAPIYPHEQTLQHAPTVIAILAMAMDTRRNWLSPVSFTCVAIFLWLHILGARYIYSFVPYDDWAINLTGKSISDLWDWKRNQYDRIVHFLFGCLCIAPAAETALKYGKLSWPWAVAFAMLTVLSVSALYEMFEWLLTVVMSPRHAESYNGQQGDIWDAQKDMSLAFAGGLSVVILTTVWRRTRKTG